MRRLSYIADQDVREQRRAKEREGNKEKRKLAKGCQITVEQVSGFSAIQ
jgi:hypothetical protein